MKAIFAVPAIGFVPAIERNINVAGGVAVVGTSTWAAMQGRKALNITWDKGPGAEESTASLQKQLLEKAEGPPSTVAAEHGNVIEALRTASKKVEADYEFPFQAHATMEPMNTTVHVRPDRSIEVWSPTQGGDLAQKTIAAVAGVPPEKVEVHVTYSGGSFGRRYQWDYLAEAYQVAKEMKVPVQLMWTREDDMQHDFYLQYSFQRLAGGGIRRGISLHGRTGLCRLLSAPFSIHQNRCEIPNTGRKGWIQFLTMRVIIALIMHRSCRLCRVVVAVGVIAVSGVLHRMFCR